jgi:hypothetical protein
VRRRTSMGSTRGISLASPQNGTTANTLNLLPSTPKTAQILAAGELGEVRKLANAEDPVCVRRGGPVCVRRGGPVCVRLVRLGELGEVRKLANAENPCLCATRRTCLCASCASWRARRGAKTCKLPGEVRKNLLSLTPRRGREKGRMYFPQRKTPGQGLGACTGCTPCWFTRAPVRLQ